MISEGFGFAIGLITLALHIAGVCFAIKAGMISRTPQASIAWGLALVIVPYVAIPLFLIFGESRFSGYAMAGTGKVPELDAALRRVQEAMAEFRTEFPAKYRDADQLANNLRGLPVVGGNAIKLLVDGGQTFPVIFEALESAREYAVVQFYIIHDDGLGQELKKRLLAAVQRGVRCWVLYDKVGSKGLPDTYEEELVRGGVQVQAFVTNRQSGRRFQMNFRNHRKLVIVDGRVAFIGGLNIGDEYIGLGPLGAWHDTHMRIEGPAAVAFQVSFLEDWYYATRTVPELPVVPVRAGDEDVLLFASGPAEPWSITSAVYCEIIHDVRERLWIASPYFVPDPMLRGALAHAALRGVDVRIILPQGIDHLLPWLSSFSYYPQMLAAGVKIWRYQPGFMHQKVLLADNDLAIVGSVNMDFRSFMLNFELAAAVRSVEFVHQVERMFEADFARSLPEDLEKFEKGSFWFRLKCRLAALMSPEQ